MQRPERVLALSSLPAHWKLWQHGPQPDHSRSSSSSRPPIVSLPTDLPVWPASVMMCIASLASIPCGLRPEHGQVDMEKRRLAAQQAALALQNRAVKEAQVQQAQVGRPGTQHFW